jgi:hypothetical protein
MGKMQREKGKRFERLIANKLREFFPEHAEIIRRSIQSREAEESDVAGLPGLWVECQDAITPTPLKKLEQAEGDIRMNKLESDIIPIAITHKIRAKDIIVTLRLSHLHYVFGHHMNDYRFNAPFALEEATSTPHVSVLLEDFLEVVKEYVGHVSKDEE